MAKGTKTLTFRQRMRTDAASQLDAIKRKFEELAEAELIAVSTEISKYDIFKLLAGGHTMTVEDRLITQLANEKEDELERIYNDQKKLDLGDDNAK